MLLNTLVVGLGNPIVRDDGVGWRIVEAAQEAWRRRVGDDHLSPAVEFDCVSHGGLALMERLVGYDRAILADAIQTGDVPGTVSRLTLDDLPTLHSGSVHDTSLREALELGRRLGVKLPDTLVVISVEAENIFDFGEELSPLVAASVGRAAEMVLTELEA